MNSKKRVLNFDADGFDDLNQNNDEVFTLKKAKAIKDPLKSLMQAEIKVESVPIQTSSLYSLEELQKLKSKQNFAVAASSSHLEGLELSGEQAEEMELLSEVLNSNNANVGKQTLFPKKVSFASDVKDSELDILSLKTARLKNLEDINSIKSTRLSTTIHAEDMEFIPLHTHKDLSSNTKSLMSNLYSINMLERDNEDEESSAVLWENELLQRAKITQSINIPNKSKIASENKSGFIPISLEQLIAHVTNYYNTLNTQLESSLRHVERLEEEYKYSLQKVRTQEENLKQRIDAGPVFQVIFQL